MTDALLPWYDREMEFFRQMGAEFAERYPKIAARLNIDASGSRDPHVERMIQAFAYLNARIRFKLDDDFPEITDAMLGVLYPHYLAPVPSMSTLQFVMDRSQTELLQGYSIPRGTPIESERVNGEACRFRTCYPVRLFPFDLVAATLASRPFAMPGTRRSASAEGLLKLEFETFSPKTSFRDFPLDSLRLHLPLAQLQHGVTLFELLMDQALEVIIASSPDDPDAVVLPSASVTAAGFDDDDALLPYSARSFPGYRLLSEYFTFPRKFLYVDINELHSRTLAKLQNRMEIYIPLRRSEPDVERLVSAESVRIGCTPIINLFEHTADAIPLTQRQSEYRIVPDARREESVEVYSVNRVTIMDEDGGDTAAQPFYSTRHSQQAGSDTRYWHAVRKPGPVAGDVAPRNSGSEMYLSLVDSTLDPKMPANGSLHVELTCFNRNLPEHLPFGGGRPKFDIVGGRGPVSDIRCLEAPTPTRRRGFKKHNLWRLISHLSLNHLSIDGTAESAAALRGILSLYDLTESADTRDMIAGLVEINSRRAVARVNGGFCRGIEMELVFDEEKFAGTGTYLYATVLSHFLGLYTTINSYTQMVATTLQKREQGEHWQWNARAGKRSLI